MPHLPRRPRRALLVGGATALAVLVLAPSAGAGILVKTATGCGTPTYERPFLRWADVGTYVLAPDGNLEGATTPWSLSGGAAVISGTLSSAVILGTVNQLVSFAAHPVIGEIAMLVLAIILLRLMPTGIRPQMMDRIYQRGIAVPELSRLFPKNPTAIAVSGRRPATAVQSDSGLPTHDRRQN